MAYTAFISYNTSPDEQVLVYRLQTLASTSDITVLLPQRNGQALSNETKLRIDKADSVIVFLTSKLSPQVREELAYAQGRNKLVIPIFEKGVRLPVTVQGYDWIEYDPHRDTPGTIEQKVLELLRGKRKSKSDRDALLLTVLGIGLLALIASASEK
ncbi:MAG: TIR domain-containing protein [Bacteroidota bacterium]